MNFLISKDEMLAALNKCIGLATKGDSPLTENVKINVGDEDITFTTSDRQSQIIASCPSSKIKTKGVTCVNAKKVNELFYQQRSNACEPGQMHRHCLKRR
jgi:DNA polymerase III sliding clamp (beta) subunit (PCNA family)